MLNPCPPPVQRSSHFHLAMLGSTTPTANVANARCTGARRSKVRLKREPTAKQTMPAAGTATQCATPGCTMSNAAA